MDNYIDPYDPRLNEELLAQLAAKTAAQPQANDLIGPKTPLAEARAGFADELKDPRLTSRIMALTNAEVGTQGPKAQAAFLESLFNRAAARGTSLAEQMTVYNPRRGTGYYPSLGNPNSVSQDARQRYEELLGGVLSGSNVGNYATGNASDAVGFAGGPQTAAYGGERFGVEGKAMGPDQVWARAITNGEIPPPVTGPAGDLAMAIPRNATTISGDAPPGIPIPGQPGAESTGNLPFGIPGTIGSNPIQRALGDNFSTLLAFAGGARQGGIGQGLTQAAKASLIEGEQTQRLKALRDQQLGIYNAIRSKGGSHGDAMAAAMSPEILKQISPDIFGSAWKFEKVKDAFGGEVPVFVNPRSGEIRDQSGKPYDPSANPATSPEGVDNIVKAVLEGRMAPPTSFAASKPYWQSILARAAQVEPGFDLTTWQARQQGMKNFTSGKDAESVRAIDQTLHHMAALVGSAKELPGTNFPLLNRAANIYRTQTGSDKENNFLINAHAVSEEMSKVYKGGNLSDAEIRSWEKSLSPNMSEEQQRGAIRKLNELLQGGIHALEEKRLGAIGPSASERLGPLLKPGAENKLKEIEGWLSPPRVGPAPPGAAPAVPTVAPAATGAPIGGTTKSGVLWSVR